MNLNIVTNEDLQNFKKELITELTAVINAKPSMQVKWLKTHQVREMLGISAGTLQSLRISGQIEYTKVGGILFYNSDGIEKMMEKEKRNVRNK